MSKGFLPGSQPAISLQGVFGPQVNTSVHIMDMYMYMYMYMYNVYVYVYVYVYVCILEIYIFTCEGLSKSNEHGNFGNLISMKSM